MGCSCCKLLFRRKARSSPNKTTETKFSWDKRDNLNKGDYIVENLTNETIIKENNSINGQQFIIQNCKMCNIFLLDHSASVTIDDCNSCFIFVGPIKTSLFIRDCRDCQLVVACQQFRTRDCKKMQIHLCCTSQPSIESSTDLSFQCYQCFYPQIDEHFIKAGLNEYNNNWSQIHDFTPTSQLTLNYSFLNPDVSYASYIRILPETLGVSASHGDSFVPFTHATQNLPSLENCLVLFLKGPSHRDVLKVFLDSIKQDGCLVAKTRELECNKVIGDRLFNHSTPPNFPNNGKLICIEVVGEDVIMKSNVAVSKTKASMKNFESNAMFGDSAQLVDKGESHIGKGFGVLIKKMKLGDKIDDDFAYVTNIKESQVVLSNFNAMIKSQMGF